ncbi:MAG: IS66 family transposase [bacterium]
MLKHWEALTRFLEVQSAPLDNNLCEQILKRSILHRKNSLFYKTEHGAYIGDLFMSLIQTCRMAGVNSFDYLTVLHKHSSALFKDPSQWLPWNYKSTLHSLSSNP